MVFGNGTYRSLHRSGYPTRHTAPVDLPRLVVSVTRHVDLDAVVQGQRQRPVSTDLDLCDLPVQQPERRLQPPFLARINVHWLTGAGDDERRLDDQEGVDALGI